MTPNSDHSIAVADKVMTAEAQEKAPVRMKALVYRGPGNKAIEDRPKPKITAPTDAIVRIVKTTICGTDLHILKGRADL